MKPAVTRRGPLGAVVAGALAAGLLVAAAGLLAAADAGEARDLLGGWSRPALPLLRIPGFDARRRGFARTFLHPRCTNCHGFMVPNETGVDHAVRPPTCSLCHTVPGWHAPAASFDLAGRTPAQICQMTKTTLGNDPVAIGNHLRDDLLIRWAIDDATVFGTLRPGGKAPPGDLATWTAFVDRWMSGGMRCD